MNREIKCKFCGITSVKKSRDGRLFCNRSCYMNWKRENPNKKAYKSRIIVNGYSYLYKPEHPNAIKNGRYVAEHRLIAEEKIGRLLTEKEVAHHIDGDTLNNIPKNIEVLTKNEHDKIPKRRNEYGQFTSSQVSCLG